MLKINTVFYEDVELQYRGIFAKILKKKLFFFCSYSSTLSWNKFSPSYNKILFYNISINKKFFNVKILKISQNIVVEYFEIFHYSENSMKM